MPFFFVASIFGWREWFYLRVGPLRVWHGTDGDGPPETMVTLFNRRTLVRVVR